MEHPDSPDTSPEPQKPQAGNTVAGDSLPPQAFRLAVEQAALAISITDVNAHILYANQAFERVTGYSAEQVVGHSEAILSYKVTPKLVYETMWAQLLRQRSWNGLLVNRRRDGSRYLADLTITPVIDGSGRTTHYLGMHRDVTEMHRLERQVQNQKALIESVVDAAPVAIVLLDESEQLILDNQEYKKLIGELGQEPAATMLAAVRANMGERFTDLRRSNKGFHGQEVRFDLPQETRWFVCAGTWFEEQDTSADAFYEPARKHYLLLTMHEVTALKRQEEALRVNALRALLAEQDRIQSLRETLSAAAYQLEGPFNMIAAALNMLERRGENGGDPLTTSLAEALKSGQAALETLRACAPGGAVEAMQPLNLNALLHDVLRLLTQRMLVDGVVVEWQPLVELPAVLGRPTELATLFKHLLENALDAIRESRRSGREIRIDTELREDSIEIAIADTGPGIPPEWQLKVFEPFFTTKGGDQQHIGMGLAVAQDIVSRHGGVIAIDPAYAGGCRVCVQLPLMREEP